MAVVLVVVDHFVIALMKIRWIENLFLPCRKKKEEAITIRKGE